MHRSQKLNICIQSKPDISSQDLALTIKRTNSFTKVCFINRKKKLFSHYYKIKLGIGYPILLI